MENGVASARALRPRRAVACHRARWLARARVATGSMSDDILEAERLLEYVFGAAKKLIYLILSLAWRCGWVPNPFYYLVSLIIFVTRAAQLCASGSLRPTDSAGPL